MGALKLSPDLRPLGDLKSRTVRQVAEDAGAARTGRNGSSTCSAIIGVAWTSLKVLAEAQRRKGRERQGVNPVASA